MKQDKERIHAYIQRQQNGCVALFDVGTKGARLLLAPSIVPSRWHKKDFELTGIQVDLGLAYNSETKELPVNSRQFKKLQSFLQRYVSFLKEEGVHDITIVGTAIFRWIDNHEECIRAIFENVGVRINVITGQQEAELSLLGLVPIHALGGLLITPADDDIVVVANQGGGSLEIAWMPWGERFAASPTMTVQLFENLGINALSTQAQNGVDVIAYIEDMLATVPFPQADATHKVYVVGMGSALTNVMKKTGFSVHNKRLNKATINEKLLLWQKKCTTLNMDVQTKKEQIQIDRERSHCMSVLIGLPTFREIITRCKSDEVIINGTGFVYQYYLAQQWHTD